MTGMVPRFGFPDPPAELLCGLTGLDQLPAPRVDSCRPHGIPRPQWPDGVAEAEALIAGRLSDARAVLGLVLGFPRPSAGTVRPTVPASSPDVRPASDSGVVAYAAPGSSSLNDWSV